MTSMISDFFGRLESFSKSYFLSQADMCPSQFSVIIIEYRRHDGFKRREVLGSLLAQKQNFRRKANK